jgi:Acyl-CoA dehydrogenase N terminal
VTTYLAPMRDMKFVINELADLQGVAALPGYEEFTPDLAAAVLEAAGKTRIVYCKDINRTEDHPDIQFTFLGHTFRPRKALDKYGRIT